MDLTEAIAPSFYDLHKDLKINKYTHYWLKKRGDTMRIKKINGYENYYISDDGKVFSNYSGELVEKTPFYSHNGYKRITLWNKGKQKKFFVHRLVAEYFVLNEKPLEYDSVDHKDTDRTNNNWWNLEWMTLSKNCAKNRTKLTKEQVLFIRKNYKKGNGTKIAKELNCDLSMVVKIAKRKAFNWIDD